MRLISLIAVVLFITAMPSFSAARPLPSLNAAIREIDILQWSPNPDTISEWDNYAASPDSQRMQRPVDVAMESVRRCCNYVASFFT